MGDQLRPCLYCGTNEHIEVTEDCCKCTECGVWTTSVRDWNFRSRIHVQTPFGLLLFYFGSSSDGDTSHWQQEYGQPDPKEAAEWVNRWEKFLEELPADIRTYSEAELAEYTKGIADQLKSVSEDGDMSEQLKPCPFCGGEAERTTLEEEGRNFGGDVITCKRCFASSHVEFGFKENLSSHWNTRTDPSLALIAAKLREAAARCDVWHRKALERAETDAPDKERHEECAVTAGSLAREILALIDTDAQAALDAYVRKEVEKAIRACDPIIPSECGVSKEMKSLTPQLRHFFENHEKWVAAAIREAGHE